MNAIFHRLLLCVVPVVGLVPNASAQGTVPEPRIALIVGVSGYDDTYFSPLQSPKVDAEKMERQLRALGFEVTILKNVKRRQMADAMGLRWVMHMTADTTAMAAKK